MGQIIHYIIVIPLILAIIYFQVKVFIQANHKIDAFKSIFPAQRLSYSISKATIVVSETTPERESQDEETDEIWREEEDEPIDRTWVREVEVSQISVPSDNPTMTDIKDSLNMY